MAIQQGALSGTHRIVNAGTTGCAGRSHMLFVLLLMVQFQLWDAVITQVLVVNGLAREANPVVAALLRGGDFLPLKLAGVAFSVLVLWVLYKMLPRTAFATTSAIAACYLLLVAWNFWAFFTCAA